MRGFHPFFRDSGGASAVEFAIVGNVFLMFVMAIAYGAMMLWHEANLDWAVQKSSRLAVINSATTSNDITNAVNDYLSAVGMSNATVQYTVSNLGGAKVAQITATLVEDFTVPLFRTYHITYTASADVPQA